MGILRLLARLFPGKGHGAQELARRLGLSVEAIRTLQPVYREFTIPKRSGGVRRILAPEEPLKTIQRCILHRVLARLKCHPAATGFERGRSIATNAGVHVGKAVVVRMDLQDFFASTRARRVYKYFRHIGWNREAADLLVRLCTYDGGLPQGAPTSPRLSNLVNYRLDARLSGLAAGRRLRNPRTGAPLSREEFGAAYTRYADDLTFSFTEDDPSTIRRLIRVTRQIVLKEGYVLHERRKLHVRRRNSRQLVTGLVVNERVNLPRPVRRWLRAVEHRLAHGKAATLSPGQVAGWRALQKMLENARK
jgi:hypothetical protein